MSKDKLNLLVIHRGGVPSERTKKMTQRIIDNLEGTDVVVTYQSHDYFEIQGMEFDVVIVDEFAEESK